MDQGWLLKMKPDKEADPISLAEIVKGILKDHLELKVERRCAGHMAPDETWLEVYFGNEKIKEVKILHEECPGEWGE
jgi:hypothetical protein